MDREFEENCMKKRTKEIEPSAVAIVNPVQINNLVKSCSKLSSYFLSGAEELLSSKTPLLSILLVYFAMEHKTYEILALKGLKVTSHVCAIKGLSKVVGNKELAAILSKAYDNRLEVNYFGNIKTAEMDRARAKRFVDETAMPFIAKVDKLILEMK